MRGMFFNAIKATPDTSKVINVSSVFFFSVDRVIPDTSGPGWNTFMVTSMSYTLF